MDFANGQQVSGSLEWGATDVMHEANLTIRKGDSLRLTGIPDWNKNPQSIHVDLSVNGVVIATDFKAANAVVHAFDTAGTYIVRVDCRHGNKLANREITVTVKEADLPDETTVVQNTVSFWTLQDALVARDLYFESGKGLNLGEFQSIDSTNYQFQLNPVEGGHFGVVVRLWENGPILDVTDITSITVTDALQNGTSSGFVSQDFPGYYLISTPMVVLDLPPGGKVVITIFRSGVTFPDGTKKKTYYAEDFVNGIVYLEFLMPIGTNGGYCHYINIYDANGALLGRR